MKEKETTIKYNNDTYISMSVYNYKIMCKDKEIERLNKENKLLKSNPNFVYAMRNNKAIEYLERKQKELEWWDTDFMQCINILKGDSNDI